MRCRICLHYSKKRAKEYEHYRISGVSSRNGLVDGGNIVATYGVGHDVGIGGGILLAYAIRFKTDKTTQFIGLGECDEVA